MEIHIAVMICNQTEANTALLIQHPTVILTQSTAFLVSHLIWLMSYFIIFNVVDWDRYNCFLSALSCWFCGGSFELPFHRAGLLLPCKYQRTCNTRCKFCCFLLLVGRPNCLCLLYKVQTFTMATSTKCQNPLM